MARRNQIQVLEFYGDQRGWPIEVVLMVMLAATNIDKSRA
jgi:hypothetical protein